MNDEYYFHHQIWIKFHSYNNNNSEGFHADVKCTVCHKWSIKILPEGSRIGTYGKHHRPLEETITRLIEILKEPVCDNCRVGIQNLEVFQKDKELREVK